MAKEQQNGKTPVENVQRESERQQESVVSALGETDAAGKESIKAEENEITASQQFAKSVGNLKQAVQTLKSDARDAEKTAKDADAEKQAVQITAEGGVISIGDALELMEAEKIAKEKSQTADSRLFKYTMEYLGEAFSGAAGVLGEQLPTLLSGGKDAFGLKSLLPLAGGAAVGLALNADSTLGNIVTDAVDGYAELKANVELGDGVEEKSIDGMEDEASYQDYMEANAGGEPSDPYASENAGGPVYDGPVKEFSASSYVQVAGALEEESNGLRITEEDLEALTDPDRIAAEPEAMSQADLEQEPEGGLLSAIAQSDVAQAVTGAVAKNVLGIDLSREQEIYDEPTIPDVPDFDF